jgi:hypothetical protein
MWNFVQCYLSGRHEYGMWCEPGSIFLRCVHCGKRSPGWSLQGAHTGRELTVSAPRNHNTGRARPAHLEGRAQTATR